MIQLGIDGQEVEIIDLTSSPPPFEVVNIESDVEVDIDLKSLPCPAASAPNKSEGRERDEGVEDGTQRVKRKNSVSWRSGKSEGRVKRKRQGTSPSGQSLDQKAPSNPDSNNVEMNAGPSNRPSSPQSQSHFSTDLFFVDVEPVVVAPTVVSTETSRDQDGKKLLLPTHVSVFGTTPVEILSQPTPDSEEDFIQFLDYDDPKEMIRYYETPPSKSNSRTVCKNCGAEGDHKTSQCTIIICLTCGARDEHPTRSCPISKVCFTCGMKGHINATCPNRRPSRTQSSQQNCGRCYSSIHNTNECPTWWRLYAYLSDEGKTAVLSSRRDCEHSRLGEGGEGYIASDQWCYNCGNTGHWGDDCTEPHRFGRSEEPSAFSSYNIATGPFYDPDEVPLPSSNNRNSRRQESLSQLFDVPDDVGRLAKQKSMAKLGKIVKDREMDDDPDDWFGNAKKSNGKPRERSMPPPPKNTKVVFGQSFRDKPQVQGSTSSSLPSLLARLGDVYIPSKDSRNRHPDLEDDTSSSSKLRRNRGGRHDSGGYRQDSHSQSRSRNDRSGYSQESQSSRSNGRWDRDRGDKHISYPGSGPRYKGGYGR